VTEKAIAIKNVEKSFGKKLRRVQALNGVSFDVCEGEAFGFIGANGAGKSTTIKIVMDIIRAGSGSVSLFGRDSRDSAARRGVSYVPESPYLYDYLTPFELVRMGVAQHKVVVPDVRAHCNHWLDRFGVLHASKRRIRKLSKGMTQRTALAHALACDPRLLILDEPLSGLDPIGRKDVVEVLREYREGGGTLLFTSHVLHDVESIADQYGLIAKGELVVQRSATDIARESPLFTLEVLSEQTLDGYVRQNQHRWIRDITREGLWAELARLETMAVQLLSVKPKLNLEAVFLEYNRAVA
jgi:ABC-2 type transport system ATP-binding protein